LAGFPVQDYGRSAIESSEMAADLHAVGQGSVDPAVAERLSQDPQLILPQLAQANISCRILPGHSLEEIRGELVRVIADPTIAVRYQDEFGQVHDVAPEG
jgi:hypothetical protein